MPATTRWARSQTQRRYRDKNRDEINRKKRLYYAENREREKARVKRNRRTKAIAKWRREQAERGGA